MCVIIDVNFFSDMMARQDEEDFATVIQWLETGGGAISVGGKLKRELMKVTSVRRYVERLSEAGRAYLAGDPEVDAEELAIDAHCSSDDPHVVALARVGGARTLCSFDRTLHQDFRSPSLIRNPRGAIYQRRSHRHVLRHCSSCPVV